jgi:hypothetical protein
MKKILVTMALVAVSAAAFAQGKINMVNDSAHPIVWTGGSLDGQLVDGLTPLGQSLLIDLYGGASAGSLTLQQTTTMSTGGLPGIFGPKTFTSANLPGGVQAFMQVQIRDSAYATAALAQAAGKPAGFSSIFTFNPSSTIAFNSIVVSGGTALSTWAPGNVTVTAPNIPEPSSMALAGIGAASLLLFRRRK